MKTALLINSGMAFGHSEGKLSETLHNIAKDKLQSYGLQVAETHIHKGYDIETELQKLVDADVWVWQFPGWWMGEPWIMKKYIDDVLTTGQHKLYTSDGRTHSDANKKYGSGGLSQHKKYMLSTTWNAPTEAFTENGQFFDAKGMDGVLFHLHLIHRFLGMQGLPTYVCYDVHKNPQFEFYKEEYEKHLKNIFG